MNDPRTDYEKGPEYARVLREVLSVIDTMQCPKELGEIVAEVEEALQEDVTINDQQWFGMFTDWRHHCPDDAGYEANAVVQWPDLAWAKDQIVKVLGS